jgi:tRNA-splicing ligase RtcB (3'-phosphate/5'-hydroxy nucleic acid ligase)
MNETVESNNATAEKQIGELDPSGFIRITGEATGQIEIGETRAPIAVVGTPAIRESFGNSCLAQAIAAASAPGVSRFILNPDAHWGYGVPVGSVLVSPTHIYPSPVGVDIKCSMSLLQTDVPEEAIAEPTVRRQLIREIEARLATKRRAARGLAINQESGFEAAVHGGSKKVLKHFGIPANWLDRCEDTQHTSNDGDHDRLAHRLHKLIRQNVIKDFEDKSKQLGSYGGGNHFGECEVVRVAATDEAKTLANAFGLRDGHVAFLSHCGSRGLGHALATNQFLSLKTKFRKRGLAYPNGDAQLVYAEFCTNEADEYLMDMALGANFATVNHLILNAIVLEAFHKVLPGTRGELVYYISHNIVRRERLDGELNWVHRKGATRAFPAHHEELIDTPYFETGHPILLPGNPRDGSSVMVAKPGASLTAFSVNHGAGRRMSRTQAKATLDGRKVKSCLEKADVISNNRNYPIDEAPDAYKDFAEVLKSVEQAGLASEVAKLQARFVIKESGGEG